MSKQNDCSLTDVHRQCLDAVLQSTARLAEHLRKCKECGLDVDDMVRENDRHREFATKAKQQFFPGYQ